MAKSSGDRFYLMEMRNRPVMYGDIGSLVKISGILLTGGGSSMILALPGVLNRANNNGMDICAYSEWRELTVEEWSDFIHRSDDPEILVGNPKIFQRKVRYEISGSIQQKVWAADGFKCMYCGKKMGEALMTIDHFIPLEMDEKKNNTSNYLTSCKSCNKDKGSQDPFIWCAERGMDPNKFVDYLAKRVIK
jgi:hypothetical protein